MYPSLLVMSGLLGRGELKGTGLWVHSCRDPGHGRITTVCKSLGDDTCKTIRILEMLVAENVVAQPTQLSTETLDATMQNVLHPES